MVLPIVEAVKFFQTFWTLLPQPIRTFILFVFAAFIALGLINLLTGRS